MGSKLLRIILFLGITGLLAAAGAAGVLYWTVLRDLPDLEKIEDYQPALASVVLDRHGERIGEFFDERRRITSMEDIPDHLVHAFVASEDGKFLNIAE